MKNKVTAMAMEWSSLFQVLLRNAAVVTAHANILSNGCITTHSTARSERGCVLASPSRVEKRVIFINSKVYCRTSINIDSSKHKSKGSLYLYNIAIIIQYLYIHLRLFDWIMELSVTFTTHTHNCSQLILPFLPTEAGEQFTMSCKLFSEDHC